MSFQYADQLFMVVNGVDVEIAEFSAEPKFDTREAVKTMNPTGRPLGTRTAQGSATFKVKVPQRAGLPAWATIQDATILFTQRVGGTPDYTATGAFYMGHSTSTDTDGEQMVDVDFGCLNWKEGV